MPSGNSGGTPSESGWIGAWGGAPYGPYPAGPISGVVPVDAALPLPSYLPGHQAVDQSFRMIIHPTIGGSTVRVRLSNLMGDRDLRIEPVRIARSLLPVAPLLVSGTGASVMFGGAPGVAIPPGSEAVSDPVTFKYAQGDDLAISFHVVGESGPVTWHAVSYGLNYVGLPGLGDVTDDPIGLGFPQPSLGWFFLSGLDVLAPDSPGTIVALGDSITDGAYALLNTRWTDFFAQRLRDAGIGMGVLNAGINSNTVTREASGGIEDGYQGPAAVSRFERDVLQRPGVRSVLIFEGTNDLSAGVNAEAVFAGLREMVGRAQAAGLCVVMGTIMTRSNTPIATWSAAAETERRKLNELIRQQTDLQGLADFERATANPLAPDLPNPLLYFPDLLHPNSLGMRVMAEAVPIESLVPGLGNCRD